MLARRRCSQGLRTMMLVGGRNVHCIDTASQQLIDACRCCRDAILGGKPPTKIEIAAHDGDDFSVRRPHGSDHPFARNRARTDQSPMQVAQDAILRLSDAPQLSLTTNLASPTWVSRRRSPSLICLSSICAARSPRLPESTDTVVRAGETWRASVVSSKPT